MQSGAASSTLQAGQDTGGRPEVQMQSLCPSESSSGPQTPRSGTICASWAQGMAGRATLTFDAKVAIVDMPQVDVVLGTAERTVKVRDSEKGWGMCS